MLNRARSRQRAQGMVEFALILALVVLIVIIALITTGGQVMNLYSNITATMCNYKVGC
ncbi:MAG: Flp family type IVb pilin [Chloroflexi bacterium]|nr:MAG: Flp family type IVb pilin [Chloroflexota bacterium]